MSGKQFECVIPIREFSHKRTLNRDDHVAVEEPMEIRLIFGAAENRRLRSLSVTMRTPGQDLDLALGFLFSEGVIRSAQDVESVEFTGVTETGEPHRNTVKVFLRPDIQVDFSTLERNFLTNSSCGVCGKASIDALSNKGIRPVITDLRLPHQIIFGLPDSLQDIQPTFSATGGIHAAGLADATGTIFAVREDIGRHNAVDKLIGCELQANKLPATNSILVVSGRASFELVQKSIVAGISMMVAIGAPSSLAIQTAERFGMALAGFASQSRFNLYTDPQQILQ
ncbi:MAG: formate dehydrogenase accessory sulfurtransferase FdhD [Pirellulaceae bacterium]